MRNGLDIPLSMIFDNERKSFSPSNAQDDDDDDSTKITSHSKPRGILSFYLNVEQ